VPAPEVAALRSAAGSHRLLLLGEMHGTREAPALAGRLAEEYAAAGPVVLVLEIHDTEQAAIGRYLDSEGSDDDLAQLLAGRFWQVTADRNDGRRNAAALALVEDMRRLRKAGREVSVLAMDPGDLDGSQSRDKAMADFIRTALARMPEGRMVVLSGNVHAMRRKPQYAPPEMQDPMGSRLADLDLFTINLGAAKGQFWACGQSECGPRKLFENPNASGPRVEQPWDYEVVLPDSTIASLVAEGKL
jgi:erythromycin esterase-like protein